MEAATAAVSDLEACLLDGLDWFSQDNYFGCDQSKIKAARSGIKKLVFLYKDFTQPKV